MENRKIIVKPERGSDGKLNRQHAEKRRPNALKAKSVYKERHSLLSESQDEGHPSHTASNKLSLRLVSTARRRRKFYPSAQLKRAAERNAAGVNPVCLLNVLEKWLWS